MTAVMNKRFKPFMFLPYVSIWAFVGAGVWAGHGAQPAYACDPPAAGWIIDRPMLPANGQENVPINGVMAVRLQFTDGFTLASASSWPDEETIRETVAVQLLRGDRDGDDVQGMLEVDPLAREVRFASRQLLDERSVYTLRVTLRNTAFEEGRDDVEMHYTFTTGTELDEVAPRFSGLVSLELTEFALPVEACCEASSQQLCCGAVCQWCWTVDWAYMPMAKLVWESARGEHGSHTMNHLLYRVDGDTLQPIGDPLMVYRGDTNERASLILSEDDPGPWCFTMIAQDIYGRITDPGRVLCATRDSIVPIERQTVPWPDRSGCLEQDSDVGVVEESDIGVETNDTSMQHTADAGLEEVFSIDAEETSIMAHGTRTNEGCSCRLAQRGQPGPAWGWFGVLVCGVGVSLARRRAV